VLRSYSRSSGTKIYSDKHDPKDQSNLLPLPSTITSDNSMIVDVEGIDKYSCYNGENDEKCHSISFTCLAQLSSGINYKISVGEGYFYEYYIKAAKNERELWICGSRMEETKIIALYHTNSDATDDDIYNGLFYTNSGSL
jgi:hypothetical protein